MNEPIAVNRYVLTKLLFFEGMKSVQEKLDAGFTKKVLLVLGGLWVAMVIVTVALGQGLSIMTFETLLTAAVMAWVALYLPWDKRRRAYKKLIEQNGEDAERTTEFFEDHLTVHTAEREVAVQYEAVRSVLTTEHLIVILTEDNTGILIDKQGFIKGTEEDLLPLLSHIE